MGVLAWVWFWLIPDLPELCFEKVEILNVNMFLALIINAGSLFETLKLF